MQNERLPAKKDQTGYWKRPLAVSRDSGGRYLCIGEDSAVVLGTGAAANSASSKWPKNHNSFLKKQGLPRLSSYPSSARFKFGDGRLGEVGPAAGITAGIAGCMGTLTAGVLEAEIPA